MLKRAYVAGVSDALTTVGAVKFASEELAAEIANSVGDAMPVTPTEPLPDAANAEVAATLVDLSNKLEEAADTAQDAATAAALANEVKEASLRLRRKLAAIMGAAVDPNDPTQDNTLMQAAQVTPEAAAEAQRRPPNYAATPVGRQVDAGKGSVGTESLIHNPITGQPEPGTNSAIENTTKAAALNNLIRKIAEGAAVTPNDPMQDNTLVNAAQVTPEAAAEMRRRPTGYAATGVGNSAMAGLERQSAAGIEMAHTGAATAGTPAPGTNSVIEQIPGKTAEDARWLQQFKEVGAKYASAFPFYMNEMEKVAGVQYMMGLAPSDRDAVAAYMRKTAELPEGLKKYIEEKKEKNKEDEMKKEDEGDSSESKTDKTASASFRAGDIVSRLRQLQGQ